MALPKFFLHFCISVIPCILLFHSSYGQTWPTITQQCPCICQFVSGPQLNLALGPGTYKQVDCRYQNLKTVPGNLPLDTEVLLLGNNNIKNVFEDILQNLPNLEYIDLSHNHLSQISDGTFQNNRQLKYLSLSWNELQVVSDGAFQSLENLTRVHLSGNKLGHIPAAIELLRSLVVIDLASNGIARIPTGSFDGLSNLQFINLQSNLITEVHANAFNNLPALTNLQLSQNSISSLAPDSLFNVPRLTSISLAYNTFKSLPENQFHSIQSIQVINLEGNQIRLLPQNIFQPLMNLLEINLQDNGLENLPPNTFRGKQTLRKINLAGNELRPPLSSQMFTALSNLNSLTLSQVPLQFESLPRQLQELKITEASLTYIPSQFFQHLPLLETLVLSENMITDIAPGAFAELGHLRYLDLSGNLLSSIPVSLFDGNLTQLEELSLQENRIKRIYQYALTDLVSLQSLNLETNLIKEILPNMFPNSIEYLHLGENPIKYFDVKAINELISLRLLSIETRNFQCDCLLQPFVEWLRINHVIVDGASDLQCNTPSRLRGVTITRLNQRQLYCIPPRILTTPNIQDVRVRRGFNVTLTCFLLPNSLASLTWDITGSRNLTMSNIFTTTVFKIDHYLLLPSGTLNVLDVTPLDSGNYTCKASNPSGTDIITYVVTVYQERETTTEYLSLTTAQGNKITDGIINLPPLTTVNPFYNTSLTTDAPGNRVPVKNLTTVHPAVHITTASARTRNLTDNSTLTTGNSQQGTLTTVKMSTKAVINVPTTTLITPIATAVVKQPAKNATNHGNGTVSDGDVVEGLPQGGGSRNNNGKVGKDPTVELTMAPKITKHMGGILPSIPTKSANESVESTETDDSTSEDPCEPNPCMHRGTCNVVSSDEEDDDEVDSRDAEDSSYSASEGGNDGTDDQPQHRRLKCTCRKKFGGPNCNIRKPETPHMVTALETMEKVIKLEWDQKIYGNVDGYVIYYSLVGSRDIMKSMPIHPDVMSYTMEELQEDSSYRICVVAFNDGGESPLGDENCIWADTKPKSNPLSSLLKTEYGIIGGGILFVILLTLLTAVCYSRGKKERDYERSVVIPRVTQSVADLPPSNVFRRSLKPRESAFYQDDLMLLDLSQQHERKMYMNPFDSRHSIMMHEADLVNPPLGFGEGIPASMVPGNTRKTLRIQEDMV